PKKQSTYPPLPTAYLSLPKHGADYLTPRWPLPFPLRRRPNSLVESCTENPSAKRILRLVSRRQSLPDSIRSMVDSETPALRASSAFAISCCSRNRWMLFTRPDLPIARVSSIHGAPGRRQGTRPH